MGAATNDTAVIFPLGKDEKQQSDFKHRCQPSPVLWLGTWRGFTSEPPFYWSAFR